jgi:hypothetical protein
MAYDAFHFCENLKKVIAPSRFTEYFKDNLGIDIIPNDMGDTNAQPNKIQSNVIESKQIIHLSMTDIKQMVMETIEKLHQK